MAFTEVDGSNPSGTLTPADYGKGSELKTSGADLTLVCGAARKSEQYITSKQWNLLWRDADLLYQSPRPLSVYENTYVLEPNVQRFTVAKVANSVVPQLYKGLFYADPPMLMRPRPGTKQEVIDAKTVLFSYLMDQCSFKTETKWGLEQMSVLGTGIWKWGIEFNEVVTKKRTATISVLKSGPVGHEETVQIPRDELPKVERSVRTVPRPFFENRPLDKVLIDPKCSVGDIRHADYVIDVRYMDFYALNRIRKALEELPKDHPDLKGWELPSSEDELRKWWMPPVEAQTAEVSSLEQASYAKGLAHHAAEINTDVTPDLLMKKLEVLEYWDKGRKIIVLDKRKVIFSGKNPFNVIPFLSANWWNRSKAFYGMGLGLIVGQNQRVDQGTINAILKILSFGVNPVYLRKRDSNAPTQMIRTGLGKILTVDGEVDKAYKLLDVPKVPSEVWSALAESEKATESSSGADQTLVQGSTAGPRTSMGRTAGGAMQLGQASATRLDGPLDNFIEQVFKPFLYILDDLVRDYLSDAEIFAILGDEMGKEYEMDLQAFHDARIEYEVLAGASMSARRTMAQSMTLLDQVLGNPQIQDSLAEVNEEYIDWKPILNMWMEASEWKNRNDIIKPMTDDMKKRRDAKSQAAQAQSKGALAAQMSDQKFKEKQALQQQSADDRIKRDLVVAAFRDNSITEATEGVPSTGGIDGMDPNV